MLTTQEASRSRVAESFHEDAIQSAIDLYLWERELAGTEECFTKLKIPEPEIYSCDGYSDTEIFDYIPDGADDSLALVYHTPYSNRVDKAGILRALSVSRVLPEPTRLIMAGSASGVGDSLASLTKEQRLEVINGNLSILTDPLIRYTAGRGVEKTLDFGWSQGAYKLTAFGQERPNGVEAAVMLDPPMVPSNIFTMTGRFIYALNHVSQYKKLSQTELAKDAEKQSPSMIEYAAGAARPTNLAAAKAMARANIEERTNGLMAENPEADLTLAVATMSELGRLAISRAFASRAEMNFGERFNYQEIEGYHSMGYNRWLLAALSYQGFVINRGSTSDSP